MFEPIFQYSHFTPHTQNSSSEGELALAENLSCPWLQSSVGGNVLCTTINGKDLKLKQTTFTISQKNHGQVTVPGSMPQTWPWRHQSLSRSNRQVSIFWKGVLTISLIFIFLTTYLWVTMNMKGGRAEARTSGGGQDPHSPWLGQVTMLLMMTCW